MNNKVKVKWIVMACLLLVGWYSVFMLPYHVPAGECNSSLSYAVGFSNKACVLVLFLLVLAMTAYRWVFHSGVSAKLSPGTGEWPVLVWFSLVFTGLVVLIGYGAPSMDTVFGESYYFVKRVELLWGGMKPYTDVEFVYGPLMIFIPAVMSVFSSVDQGYLAALVMVHLVSLWLVYFVSVRIGGGVVVFSVACLILLGGVLSMGLQYTGLRYVLPYAILLHVWNKDGGAVKSLMFSLLAMAVSPETGFTTIAGLAVMHGVKGRNGVVPAVATLCALPVGMLVFPSGYLSNLSSYLKGVGTFPVEPTAFVLMFMAAFVIAVPRMLVSVMVTSGKDKALWLGLSAVCVLFSVPALGRCDGGHVLFNGLGTVMLALVFVGESRWRGLALAVSLTVGVWLLGMSAVRMAPAVSYAVNGLNGMRGSVDTSVPPLVAELRLDTYAKVGVPFGAEDSVERYLRRAGRCEYGFFVGCYDFIMADSVAVDRKMKSLSKADVLLVPVDVFQFRNGKSVDVFFKSDTYRVSMEKGQSGFLTSLQLYPYRLKYVNSPYIPHTELMKRIAEEYYPFAKSGGFYLMTRNIPYSGQIPAM